MPILFASNRQLYMERVFKEDELFDIFHVLISLGGYCDCEILYNAAGDSRLKREYWTARSEGREPRNPHEQPGGTVE